MDFTVQRKDTGLGSASVCVAVLLSLQRKVIFFELYKDAFKGFCHSFKTGPRIKGLWFCNRKCRDV